MSSDFESTKANDMAEQDNQVAESPIVNSLDRRHFLVGAAAGAAAMVLPRFAHPREKRAWTGESQRQCSN